MICTSLWTTKKCMLHVQAHGARLCKLSNLPDSSIWTKKRFWCPQNFISSLGEIFKVRQAQTIEAWQHQMWCLQRKKSKKGQEASKVVRKERPCNEMCHSVWVHGQLLDTTTQKLCSPQITCWVTLEERNSKRLAKAFLSWSVSVTHSGTTRSCRSCKRRTPLASAECSLWWW